MTIDYTLKSGELSGGEPPIREFAVGDDGVVQFHPASSEEE